MKPTFLIALAALLMLGCQKDIVSTNQDYMENARNGLQDSLGKADFQALDFAKAARSGIDNIGLYYLRVPFKQLKPDANFVLVKTNHQGIIESGKIVHLKGSVTEQPMGRTWNGEISLTSLDKKRTLTSAVVNGYITALHQHNNVRVASHAPPDDVMPEVIITYIRPSGGGDVSWSTWFMLQIPTWDGGSGSGGAYYSDFSGGGTTGGGGGSYSNGSGGSSAGNGYNDPVILVDLESQDRQPEINIQEYIACFNNIPDEGATCSIEISTDIPVDSNPNSFYNFSTGSPGHAFITVTKKNGAQSVSQNIGFYPKSGYKAMTYAPTAGKLVDNAKHEFNASFKMDLTPAQLKSTLIRMQQLSKINYDVDSYNCTDWALDIFNNSRTDKLKIPLYGIPDSPMTQGSQTPQGLYQKLQQMVKSDHPEKRNITIGIIKGYAGGSTGPCQ